VPKGGIEGMQVMAVESISQALEII